MPYPAPAANRRALDEYFSLEQRLSDLASKLDTGTVLPPNLEALVSSAQRHLAGLGAFLSDAIDTAYYTERVPPGSTAAPRTFAVPELLEMVLSYLTVPELLVVYQVSRSMRDAIEGSPELLTRMGLLPATANSHLATPFDACFLSITDPKSNIWSAELTGFFCSQIGSKRPQPRDSTLPQPPHTTVEVPIRAKFSHREHGRLPHIGSRIRRMLICQPPIKEMAVTVDCCEERRSRHVDMPMRTSVSSDTGLTIGDLYDCTEFFLREHRDCPNATFLLYDGVGRIDPGVEFKTTVTLRPDDPIAIKELRRKQASAATEEQNTLHSHKLNAYRKARMRARATGTSVPAFSDFLEQHPDETTDWRTLAQTPLGALTSMAPPTGMGTAATAPLVPPPVDLTSSSEEDED